jgi:hypothetical protein
LPIYGAAVKTAKKATPEVESSIEKSNNLGYIMPDTTLFSIDS